MKVGVLDNPQNFILDQLNPVIFFIINTSTPQWTGLHDQGENNSLANEKGDFNIEHSGGECLLSY